MFLCEISIIIIIIIIFIIIIIIIILICRKLGLIGPPQQEIQFPPLEILTKYELLTST